METFKFLHQSEKESNLGGLTILRHQGCTLAKTWQRNGAINAYGQAKYFTHAVEPVRSIRDLSALLTQLENDRHACVIRGSYVGDERAKACGVKCETGKVQRLGALFEDKPQPWVMVEIDKFVPTSADPVTDPVAAITEFKRSSLPSTFHNAAYHWQLSNSAGHPKNKGKLKAHVWFWLKTPRTSTDLKQWAINLELPIDTSVLNTVQIHYTAAPLFEEGVTDPVAQRSGFVDGALDVAIDAPLPDSTRSLAPPLSSQQRLAHAAANDPVAVRLAELGLHKSTGTKGDLRIVCPLADKHGTESGESSTVYFPANTGGYSRGAFNCFHAGCSDSSHEHYLAAIGIEPEEFENLTVESKDHCLETERANAARIVNSLSGRLTVVDGEWFGWGGDQWKRGKSLAIAIAGAGLKELITAETKVLYARADGASDPIERMKIREDAGHRYAWVKTSCSTRVISGSLAQAESPLAAKFRKEGKEFDMRHELLNFSNCTVNLKTGEPHAHNPKDLVTKCIKHKFVPHAVEDTGFYRFLSQLMCEENKPHQPKTKCLWTWLGYCMTGEVSEKLMAIMYGCGSSGKSTLFSIITAATSPYSCTAAPDLLTVVKNSRHPTEMANLAGTRLVTAHEFPKGERLRVDFIKQATGGDKIKARFLNQDFFEFTPTHKFQILTNHLPVLEVSEEAMWLRLLTIPFQAQFVHHPSEVDHEKHKYRIDTGLVDRLISTTNGAEGMEGVVACLVAGAREWYRAGIRDLIPEDFNAAKDAYRRGEDTLGHFLESECEMGDELEVRVSDLYLAHVRWSNNEGIPVTTKVRFCREMHARNYELLERKEKGAGRRPTLRYFKGLGLADTTSEDFAF